MIETPILDALQTAVAAAVAASIDPTLPVKYIGRTLETTPMKYLEIVQIINNMTNEYWGNERVYRGVLRLILHWPVDDAGAMPGSALRDSIASHFSKDLKLWSGNVAVQIFDHPSASSVIEAGAEQLFPLSIPYRSFAR